MATIKEQSKSFAKFARQENIEQEQRLKALRKGREKAMAKSMKRLQRDITASIKFVFGRL